jgi:hypothetical protein
MGSAVQTRQRMLALALPLTAGLYIGAEGLDPKGTDRIVTTTAIALKVLPLAAKHSTQLYASGSLSELALGAVAVSYGAIARLVRKRGSMAATIAVLIGGIGPTMWCSSSTPMTGRPTSNARWRPGGFGSCPVKSHGWWSRTTG